MQLKEQLERIPGLACPSSDRLSGVLRKLAQPTIIQGNKKGTSTHEFCIDDRMNGLMLDIVKRLGVIETDILDYDNTCIETLKFDSAFTYKKFRGYQPGVSFMGKIPVYVEGRNGNTPASFKMGDALRNNLDLLAERNIKVKMFRSDAAAYQHEVIELMSDRNIEFFIRVVKNNALNEELPVLKNWTQEDGYELSEMEHIPFINDYKETNPKRYRLVAKRALNEDGKYIYHSILTSNRSMTMREVVEFYNQRGAIEKNFDEMKNHFNWNSLPFSLMNQNVVFMIVQAIGRTIFQYVLKKFSSQVDYLDESMFLKAFTMSFIVLSSFWTAKGKLKLFTTKNYSLKFD